MPTLAACWSFELRRLWPVFAMQALILAATVFGVVFEGLPLRACVAWLGVGWFYFGSALLGVLAFAGTILPRAAPEVRFLSRLPAGPVAWFWSSLLFRLAAISAMSAIGLATLLVLAWPAGGLGDVGGAAVAWWTPRLALGVPCLLVWGCTGAAWQAQERGRGWMLLVLATPHLLWLAGPVRGAEVFPVASHVCGILLAGLLAARMAFAELDGAGACAGASVPRSMRWAILCMLPAWLQLLAWNACLA